MIFGMMWSDQSQRRQAPLGVTVPFSLSTHTGIFPSPQCLAVPSVLHKKDVPLVSQSPHVFAKVCQPRLQYEGRSVESTHMDRG